VADFAQVVLGWGNARGWGRAAVMPDPVRRQRHRRSVVPSHGPVARDQRRTLVAVGIHSPLATRHSPPALPDSEFGDPELGPLCMHDMLRNATFCGVFEIMEARLFFLASY